MLEEVSSIGHAISNVVVEAICVALLNDSSINKKEEAIPFRAPRMT
jgi:hypothetical protein